MAVLITGGSGFLGTALTDKLLAKGRLVYSLSRHPPADTDKLLGIRGDILEPDLGPDTSKIKDLDAVYHLAAIHKLGPDKDGLLQSTNCQGTRNVIDYCLKRKVPHLYFCSTAYTQGRNPYERSKVVCEEMVTHSKIPEVTIFKPSIVMGTSKYPYPGHFSQFVSVLVRILQRASIIKSAVEGTLRLPVLQPVFRIKGNPAGKLNMVDVEAVASAMADIYNVGTFMLTHPNPPILEDLVRWVGEFILVDFRIVSKFNAMPLELMFAKLTSAFEPYLEGDSFSSDLPPLSPITKEFIYETIHRSID